MTSFEVNEFKEKDPNGAFDYTNSTKYGADFVTTENGLTKYTASYEKAIIFKINTLAPETANVNIDNVKLETSDSSQIPAVNSFKDGIFAINANKDDDGHSVPGKAILTFKSTLGVEQKIIVEFTKAVLKSVKVNFTNNAPTYSSSSKAYVFDSIYENKFTPYFFINTDPDEDIYEYGIDIIDGDSNGISLIKFEKGNAYGNPDFSFAILGNKVGTYKFKVYVKDYNVYDTKTFEITVREPISSSSIEKNIVGKSFIYKGFSSITSVFTFVSNSRLQYKETTIDNEYITNFNYHIENGSIIVDGIQSFTKGSYFGRINNGEILFSDDYKKLEFHLEIYDADQLEDTSFFQYYTYEEYVEPIKASEIAEYIENRTFMDSNNTISVTFSNGKGTLVLCDYEGNEISTFTFDYEYSEVLQNIVISNTTSSNADYELVASDYVFNYYSQVLEFKIHFNNEWGGFDYKYTTDLR